jgi:hypothetical protein
MEVNNLGFHPNSFKKVFWIADAPPHGRNFIQVMTVIQMDVLAK